MGGLGVKIGAIGKVTEIGMQVKTEETPTGNATPIQSDKKEPKANPQQQPASREIQVVLDTGEPEPKIASMLVPDDQAADGQARPTSPPLLIRPAGPTIPPKASTAKVQSPTVKAAQPRPMERVTSPPPLGRVTSPPPTALLVLARALSPPPLSRTLSPPPVGGASALISRALSPPPFNRPMSPTSSKAVAAKSEEIPEDVIAGSENAFIRSIRSPTREPSQPGASQVSSSVVKRAAGSDPVPPKPTLKSEINIPVSGTSLTPAPRERIIPIRVEGREQQDQQQQQQPATPKVSSPAAVVSIQRRGATPPRIASPPPMGKPVRSK